MARHEKSVAQILSAKGFEEFSPMYKSRQTWGGRRRTIMLPLFPGYIFCRFDEQKKIPILNTIGVIDIVRFGNVIAVVDPTEIAAIRGVTEWDGSYEPWPSVEVGTRVKLDAGPLVGVEGVILEVRNFLRFIISITLLGRSVSVEIDREWISPLGLSNIVIANWSGPQPALELIS